MRVWLHRWVWALAWSLALAFDTVTLAANASMREPLLTVWLCILLHAVLLVSSVRRAVMHAVAEAEWLAHLRIADALADGAVARLRAEQGVHDGEV